MSYELYLKDYYYYANLIKNKKNWVEEILNINLSTLIYFIKNNKINKDILKDFKKCINYSDTLIDTLYSKNIYYHCSHLSDLLSLLLKYGLELKKLEYYYKLINSNKIKLIGINNEVEDDKLLIKKLIAGKKIANAIENAMDDEKEMKPLRTKIDLRKYLNLINN